MPGSLQPTPCCLAGVLALGRWTTGREREAPLRGVLPGSGRAPRSWLRPSRAWLFGAVLCVHTKGAAVSFPDRAEQLLDGALLKRLLSGPGDLLSTEGARGRRGGQRTAPSRAPRSPEWGRSCTCPGRATSFLPRRPAPRFHRDASSLVLGSWQPREPADQAVRAEVAV